MPRALVLAALILGIATPAQAQMACGTRDTVIASLGEKYGEVWRGGGLSWPTAIFEIWASEATGTWPILKTTPNGWACGMAVGAGGVVRGGEPGWGGPLSGWNSGSCWRQGSC